MVRDCAAAAAVLRIRLQHYITFVGTLRIWVGAETQTLRWRPSMKAAKRERRTTTTAVTKAAVKPRQERFMDIHLQAVEEGPGRLLLLKSA